LVKAGKVSTYETNVRLLYTNRGSYVFACFVDFHEAFDRVNYWKLFLMLLDDGVEIEK